MKVLKSLKSAKTRDKNCRIVKRKGRTLVINKINKIQLSKHQLAQMAINMEQNVIKENVVDFVKKLEDENAISEFVEKILEKPNPEETPKAEEPKQIENGEGESVEK